MEIIIVFAKDWNASIFSGICCWMTEVSGMQLVTAGVNLVLGQRTNEVDNL